MASSLSWLDHSEYERQRALEIISAFEDQSTVDELGIGTVRDAISDLLFPGTSVLHPRARYFLIVPWVYLHLESKRVSSAEIAAKARTLETNLIDVIIESDDSKAAIGRIAGKDLKQLPSTGYWAGLSAWGLRTFVGGQSAYHRWLDRYYRIQDAMLRTQDGERASDGFRPTWRPSIPKPPPGFPKQVLSLRLTRAEAEYLQERILAHHAGTLLAHLVAHCKPAEGADFIWTHPEFAGFSENHKSQLEHARNLSELALGAVRMYNLMLAERTKRSNLAAYRKNYSTWCDDISARRRALKSWNREDLWITVRRVNPRIAATTRAFLDAWMDLVLGPDPYGLPASRQARSLIQMREVQLKGPRLARLENESARNSWRGQSGGQLGYRWNPQVRQITADIQRGLRSRA